MTSWFPLLLSVLYALFAFPNIPEPRFFTQKINHFASPGKNQATFQQRYWVVEDFWTGEGPVFLYLCGEYECPGIDQTRLFPIQVAAEHQALVISVEHRFYGRSLPYTVNGQMQEIPGGLEVQQALADVAGLIRYLKDEKGLGEKKWIVIGGGYAGALAAWFRTRYPHLVHGAWASSAIVNPILDFSAFDRQVYISAMKSGPECVSAIRDISEFATSLYEKGEISHLTNIFNATHDFHSEKDKVSMLWYLADLVSELISQGHRTELCEEISSGDVYQKFISLSELGNVRPK